MKTYNIALLALALCPLASCVSEEIKSSKDTGLLTVDVVTKQPYGTRAQDTSNFPVTIFASDGSTVLYSYTNTTAIPLPLTLEVGTYVLESHTPGNMSRIMTEPYYKGRTTTQIQKGITNQEIIGCKQANGSIKVHYEPDFLALFSTWTLTFDDGGNGAIAIDNSNGNDPAKIYVEFAQDVKKLTLNFRGTTTEGNTIAATKILTKSQATETYNGDTENFGGGDAIVVNLNPVHGTTGKVTIGVTASLFVDETKEIIIQVEDDNTGTIVTPPQSGSNEITLSLPADMVITAATDPSLGDATISANAGIKSLVVSASSTNSDMVSALAAFGLIAGTDIVTDHSIGTMLSVAMPSQGDKTYTFPIGAFFAALTAFQGEHTFDLAVEDMDGNKNSGSVTLTVE